VLRNQMVQIINSDIHLVQVIGKDKTSNHINSLSLRIGDKVMNQELINTLLRVPLSFSKIFNLKLRDQNLLNQKKLKVII